MEVSAQGRGFKIESRIVICGRGCPMPLLAAQSSLVHFAAIHPNACNIRYLDSHCSIIHLHVWFTYGLHSVYVGILKTYQYNGLGV